MKKLIEFPDDSKFYRGTIIVLKNVHKSPKGDYDCKYALIGGHSLGAKFGMLDLYRGIGGIIVHDLEPNIPGHFAVNKEGIKKWVEQYFEFFYTEEGKASWIPQIDEITYIEDLDQYFVQANRDLFL